MNTHADKIIDLQNIRVIEGDAEAVAAATLYPDSGDPINLRGGWNVITPAWAQSILTAEYQAGSAYISGTIRKADKRTIDHMAVDMRNRGWRATGEAIVFADNGRLLDGHKRLRACIIADTPFVAIVLIGVSRDCVDTVNNLRSRRLSDILKNQLEPHPRSFATMLQCIWRMRKGGFDVNERMGSDQELLGLLDAYPLMRDSMGRASSPSNGRKPRLGIFAACDFLFYHVDATCARDFVRALFDDGSGKPEKRLPMSHPARLLNDSFDHERNTGRLEFDTNRRKCAAAMVLAWNAFRENKPIKSVYWEPIDANDCQVPFPTISGWEPQHDLVGFTREIGARPHQEVEADQADTSEATTKALVATSLILTHVHPLTDAIWTAAFPNGNPPSVSLRMIGPREAEEYLIHNTANRDVVSVAVARYIRDMETDAFVSLNGQTVKVADTGRLIDSQHRMKAIVISGARLPFVVVSGLDEEVYNALDRGDTRTYMRVLSSRNIQNAGQVAAACRFQWMYEYNRFTRIESRSPSNPELNDVLSRNPGLATSHYFINRLRSLISPPSVICWLEYQLKSANEALATEFLTKLTTGENLNKGDPILVLRKKMTDMALSRSKSKGEGTAREASDSEERVPPVKRSHEAITLMALTIMAFNAWVEGRTVSAQGLTWQPGEKSEFPTLNMAAIVAKTEGVVKAKPKRGRAPKKAPELAAPAETAPAETLL